MLGRYEVISHTLDKREESLVAKKKRKGKTKVRSKKLRASGISIGGGSKTKQLSRRSGGGAATTSGTTFQEDIASYFAVMMLAEEAVQPPLGLIGGTVLNEIAVETDQPIDDLTIGTSAGGNIFVQCKSSLALSSKSDSQLDKCAQQIARQFIAGCRGTDGLRRALDPRMDRMVIAVGPKQSTAVSEYLGDGLDAVRSTSTPAQCEQVLSQQSQNIQHAVAIFKTLCNKEAVRLSSKPLSDMDWLRILQLTHVWQFDFRDTGSDRAFAGQVLRSNVISSPKNASVAQDIIVRAVRGLGPRRAIGSRSFFQQALESKGIALRLPLSFEADIKALRSHTSRRLSMLKDLSCIPFGDKPVKIKRKVVGAVVEMAKKGNVLVVGEPGAGKSGCIYDVARSLSPKSDVLLLAVDVTNTESLAALSADIGLSDGRLLPDVLAHWPGDGPAFLIVDALDAARNKDSLPTFKNLVEQIQVAAPRWQVIASMREFDLKHSPIVRELFEGTPHATHVHADFSDVRHIYVRRLGDDELKQAQNQCPPLAAVVDQRGGDLEQLVRNPFNLLLLIELLSEKVEQAALAAVRIQVQLLDLYWDKRVVQHDPEGIREKTATSLVEIMRTNRTLFANEERLQAHSPFLAAGLTGLQQQGVIRAEDAGPLAGSLKRYSFAHNILFDYAAARLWLRDLPESVLDSLASPQNEDLLLFARPSLVFSLERLWYANAPNEFHQLFWARVVSLASRTHMRLIGKIAAASVVASELKRVDDARPLLTLLRGADNQDLTTLLQTVVSAALTRADAKGAKGYIWGEDAPEWLGIAAALTEMNSRKHAWLVRNLLAPLVRDKNVRLSSAQLSWSNSAARALLEWGFTDSRLQGNIPIALFAACRTIAAAPTATIRAVEPILEPEARVHRHEYLRFPAQLLSRLARYDGRFTLRVSRAAFLTSYNSDDRVNRGPRLLPMNFSKEDEMRFVRESIAKSLPRIFRHRPALATAIAASIFNITARGQMSGSLETTDGVRFPFMGTDARLLLDHSSIWGDRSYSRSDPWFAVRKAFISGLVSVATNSEKGVLEVALRRFVSVNRFAVGSAANSGNETPLAEVADYRR